ncbi:RDD family protein [Hymenobacter sp. 5317J-9]|uniref:RDD family protein n=1 Tax=Hymenobacter sp. 5317J-9 TaxID=2932250 RepID=UPI001FD6E45F|nr:RDD family protein [Hymenobacter sp. 5317J-9]UOQ99288.1 RDD family protein [Hymenobacter sp. 5317J-9]
MQQDYSFPEFTFEPVAQVEASTGQRFGNHVIDIITFYFLLAVLAFGTAVVLIAMGYANLDRYLEGPTSTLVIYLMMFVYYFVLEVSTGRTIGKLLTRTRVVMEDGSELTTKAIFLRSLCRMIPFDAFSFLSGNPGWHDTFSKTRVVQIAR